MSPRFSTLVKTAPAKHTRRLLIPSIFLFSILLLLSLACSLPSLSPLSPTAPNPTVQPLSTRPAASGTPPAAPNQPVTPQAVAPAPRNTAAANLSPALVEVEPQPQSQLAPGASPVFYFNQPMQRASVETAFKSQPDLGGKFEWLNDTAVRYVPSKALAPGAALNVTIEASAKAANGLALPQPVQISYQAAGPLRLAERLPAPDASDVNPASAVVVTFNHPVVPLGADAQGLPPAFTLDPAANGRGEWLNTSTYIFYPQPALMGGARYTVRLSNALKSADGSALAADTPAEWAFSTAAPVLLSIKPTTEQPILLDTAFTLTFNQPMDPASVQNDFSLIAQKGGPVAGKLSWNSDHTELTFQPNELLQRSTGYTLALFGTARSQGGAAIGKDFAATLTTVPQFAVTQTRPEAGQSLESFSGYATLTLTFSSPAASGQDFKSLITLDPPIGDPFIYRDPASSQVLVSGYFKPSLSYKLSISPELKDRWGAKLGAPFTLTFNSQPAQPALIIPARVSGSRSFFVPANETAIPAQATNITRLTLSRGQLSLQDFILAETEGKGLEDWPSRTQANWPLVLYPKANVNESINIPLAQDNSRIDPGLYFFKIDPQPSVDPYNQGNPQLLVVSPIQIIFKTSASQAFVWAVKVPENTPVANALVSIVDETAKPLGTCTTDASGICQVDLPKHAEPYKGLFAVHGKPGDADFSLAASDWTAGVNPWEFNLPYQYEGSQPDLYLYTDRPIYRPGQAVDFRVIVRAKNNGRYMPPAQKQVTVQVLSPFDALTGQNQTLTTMRLALDPFGSASGVYTLPADAKPGRYNFQVQEVPFQTVGFDVAEYRKPEIDLQVKFDQPDALVGKDLKAQVSAKYFFGAPAGGLPVHWTLFRTPGFANLPDGLSSGKVDTSWLLPWGGPGGADMFVMDGQTQTAPDGTLTISFAGQDLRERLDQAASDLQNLKLEVTVADESGLPVSARTTLRLHPSPFYIGMRPEQWTVGAGQEITYFIRTVDWQGNPLAGKALSAHFRKVVWVQSDTGSTLMDPTYSPQYTDISSTDFNTSDQGEARLAFTPPEPGTYMLEITGEEGAVSQVLTWVGGQGAGTWPNLPNQRILLRADAKSYQPGQTAHIFVPNPYPDGALALVTVERAKVMRSFTVQLQGASYDLQLPLSAEDAPNVYVSVTLLGRSSNRPDFRMGYLNLSVDPAGMLLAVTVETSPQQAQPGGDLTLNIRVKDAQGQPVQGEFSLALIDKAVLALADPNTRPIDQAYYGEQPLGVLNSLSLAVYGGRFIVSPPGRGGGGGAGELALPVRSKFADTAYWNGAIQTDVTGVAQVTLKLPDNLTTWQADVRGLTADARVGQARVDLLATKPLLIRPVAPRFVVLGDHIELAAVVNNNTQAALKTSVRLEAAGFTLDDPNQAAQPVEIPAGDRRRVSWWGTVQDVPALDLAFSVESDASSPAGALQDAARPEISPLPVRRYTAPQSFGTAGMLPDAGERTELVSLPRSFTPQGGSLTVELSPSLSAAVIDGLKALKAYPEDFTEPVISNLLPNLAAAQAFKDLKLDNDPLRADLAAAISDSTQRLVRLQNQDGGWGWSAGTPSDAYISSYALLSLTRAAQSGVFVDEHVLQNGKAFLVGKFTPPTTATEAWEADRQAFMAFVLQQSGQTDLNLGPLYDFRGKLSPWGRAFLALTLHGQSAADARVNTLVSDLQASASRSATGASWQDTNPAWRNWSTPNFTTAVAAYALAQLDPKSPMLIDAVRYLALNRNRGGGWSSSYESAWALMALTETMRGTGDAQASYAFSARLDGSPLVDSKVETITQAASPVNATVPLSKLNADSPNPLVIQRGAGSGRLYYRAYLQVSQPAQDAPAVDRGLSIQRQYYRAGQDCRKETCQPLDAFSLADPQPVQVRLTLTVPEDRYYVVVEDSFPAGTEVLNPRLKTSQQNVVPQPDPNAAPPAPPYDLSNPFDQGWGWWLFDDPQVYDDHIRWVVDYLPAGTYELTYRLTPLLAGEFRVIPAHAWEYYFPDVEGSSKGSVLTIK